MTRKTFFFVILVVAALAVALAGCQTASTASPTPTKAPPAATQAPAGGAASGQAVFQKNCEPCHPGGEAGVGPSLKASTKSVDEIKTQVRQGKGQMPAFDRQTISDAELEALATYVKSLQR